MGLVTAFCPLTTTGPGETVVQTADALRLVVDSKVDPVTLVGHVKITVVAEAAMVSCGGLTGNAMLNTVPAPELPPRGAAPYRVLPDKTKPAFGKPPSLLAM